MGLGVRKVVQANVLLDLLTDLSEAVVRADHRGQLFDGQRLLQGIALPAPGFFSRGFGLASHRRAKPPEPKLTKPLSPWLWWSSSSQLSWCCCQGQSVPPRGFQRRLERRGQVSFFSDLVAIASTPLVTVVVWSWSA